MEKHKDYPTRSQLIGMIAALRGIIHTLQILKPEEIDDADRLEINNVMKYTAININEDTDLVDGYFDHSWRD